MNLPEMFRRSFKLISMFRNATLSNKRILEKVGLTLNDIRISISSCRCIGSHAQLQNSVSGLFKFWKKKFEDESISEPEESITNILAYCLNTRKLSDVQKMSNKIFSPEKVQEVRRLCEKRLRKMPIQYVIEEWQFRELTLKMAPSVFIPRPETEELVDLALKEIDGAKLPEIVDLCCGSGAIALSLLHERLSLKATAVDQSRAACALTMENAQKLGVENRIHAIHSPLRSDLIKDKVGLIVSNPPYIFTKDMANLQEEIKLFEDLKALDGGEDGLDVVKLILKISSEVLHSGGKLLLEVDPRHPLLLRRYLIKNSALGLDLFRIFKDFCGQERFVEIIKT